MLNYVIAWVLAISVACAVSVCTVEESVSASSKVKSAKPLVRVAIIDTGYDFARLRKDKLCDSSLHRDFSGEGLGSDIPRHGSNVASLIMDAAGDADYCLVIIKAHDFEGYSSLVVTNAAFAYAVSIGVDIINASFVGYRYDVIESKRIKYVLSRNIVLVAAAGNDSKNLDLKCNAYPACSDPRVIAVGCIDCPWSNYGKVVDTLELGMDRKGGGVIMSGTSMATATATGRRVLTLSRYYKKHGKSPRTKKKIFKLLTGAKK